MVIAGTINRVAFYCRVNHRDRDYDKYLDDVMRWLEEEYGKQKWNLQIFFEEAEIVSLTFDLYLMNVGSSRIGELLDYLGVKTVTGTTWESGTIYGMLCNEKYKGDFHLQKYYTPENKRNHTRKNNGLH